MTNEERDKTIAQIERIQKHLASVGETVDYLDFAIEALETQTWIPVSERLPENYTKVLVTYRGRVIEAKLELVGYDNRRMWNSDSLTYLEDATNGNVTAWMPLPQSYREDKADDE